LKICPSDSRGEKRIPVDVSAGELLDRIAILQLKVERSTDSAKAGTAGSELARLEKARDAAIEPSPALAALCGQLAKANATLWDLEDRIRAFERGGDFGAAFVEAARSIARTNDRRADLKRCINDLLGSPQTDEKSYNTNQGV
jgi:hypothetical protein